MKKVDLTFLMWLYVSDYTVHIFKKNKNFTTQNRSVEMSKTVLT